MTGCTIVHSPEAVLKGPFRVALAARGGRIAVNAFILTMTQIIGTAYNPASAAAFIAAAVVVDFRIAAITVLNGPTAVLALPLLRLTHITGV